MNCRYTPTNRRAILQSGVRSTLLLNQVIASRAHPPRIWLNASTATIYRHSLDRAMDEATGELGGKEPDAPDTWNFSIDAAKAWEHAFFSIPTPRTRIARDDLQGAVNLASPNPLPNRHFLLNLREAWGIRIGLPTPEWLLEIGTFLMRTESELVLKSRRVIPGRLLDAGFHFLYPDWPAAARDLVARCVATYLVRRALPLRAIALYNFRVPQYALLYPEIPYCRSIFMCVRQRSN